MIEPFLLRALAAGIGLPIIAAPLTLVSGNTNAPVVMIAERASDLIRGRTPA